MSVITPSATALPAMVVALGGVRFGITVSRRQARRAVARNAVKRVVREAARRQAPALEASLAGKSLDILFRLKAPLPPPAASAWADVKAQLRREADSLLEQLAVALRAGDSLAGTAQLPRNSLAQSARAGKDARTAVPGARPAPWRAPAGT